MERFTLRTVSGTALLYLGNSSEWAIISGRNNNEYKISGDAVDRLAAYEDTGLEPQDIISAVDMAKIACALHELNAYKDLGPIDHIRDLIKAEQDGRLVLLPCKVGDDVWFVRKFGKERCITQREVDCVNIDSRGNVFVSARRISGGYIGKTVFLTREEAEAALKGGEG